MPAIPIVKDVSALGVDHQLRWLVQGYATDVPDHADDFSDRPIVASWMKLLADRILAGPKLVRDTLRNQCHVALRVTFLGEPALPQGNARGLKIIGSDKAKIREGCV